MRMTEAASESRRMIDAAAAAAPARVAAARMALIDAGDRAKDMGERARDLVASMQTRARDQIDRRRSRSADRLESLADVLRPSDQASRARHRTIAGSSLALAAVLGAGVALGLVVSRELKKRADLRAAEAKSLIKETPPMPQPIEQDPASAGLNL